MPPNPSRAASIPVFPNTIRFIIKPHQSLMSFHDTEENFGTKALFDPAAI
jgi:hypothetical protein